jgi:hypothetical protein
MLLTWVFAKLSEEAMKVEYTKMSLHHDITLQDRTLQHAALISDSACAARLVSAYRCLLRKSTSAHGTITPITTAVSLQRHVLSLLTDGRGRR